MYKAIATKDGGVRVKMTPEEEKAFLDQRAIDQADIDKENAAQLEKEAQDKKKSDDLMAKLKTSLGLTDDEIDTLKKL